VAEFHDEDDARERLQAHLASDERIEWIGGPDAGSYFSLMDVWLIPLGLLFTWLAIYAEVTAFRDDASILPRLLILVILFAGLYLVFGRYIYKHLSRKRTTYAITSSRAIILVGANKLDDMPAAGEALAISFSPRRSHMTVIFGHPDSPDFATRMNVVVMRSGWLITRRSSRYQPIFVLIDVADVAGLTKALTDVRHQPLDRIMDV
jgi:hypothetical protein